jgi:hypothetical protein
VSLKALEGGGDISILVPTISEKNNQGRLRGGRYMAVFLLVMIHSGKEMNGRLKKYSSIMAKEGSVLAIMAKGGMGNLQADYQGDFRYPEWEM